MKMCASRSRRYAGAALTVLEGTGTASCCGSAGERGLDSEALGVDWTGGYSVEELGALPQAAGAFVGVWQPHGPCHTLPREVVLDLGSGGGIDVLLSAKSLPWWQGHGLDMTDEMLALAEKNRAEAGVENVEFLKGHIEEIPLPDDHVDVVISNCVINLSTDKPKVISEAFRVLKPGGRFAVSDMVFLGDKGRLPDELVRSMEAWSGCVSGALEKDEYEALLREAGFEDVSVEVTHTYEEEFAEASGCCGGSGCCGDTATTAAAEVPLASAFIEAARRPSGRRWEYQGARGRGGEWRPQGRHRGARGGSARRPGPRPLGPHTGEDALYDGRRPRLLRVLRLRRARSGGG